ncbi:MAG: hypothetical protein LBR38_08255 [Synergistaceae bacterium]|nr:hypothetical protein [Synergistaceae bacterium]
MRASGLILFGCAAVMFWMGMKRREAGEKGLAFRDFLMAAILAIFGIGFTF